MLNEAGSICSMVDLVLATFAVISLGKQDMILGFTWQHEHNPEIDWTKGEVKMSCCPHCCITCAEEAHKKQRAKVHEHAAVHACHAGHFPYADLNLLIPPLEFPYREALYKDVQGVGCKSLEKEGGEGEWTSISDAESPDETAEPSILCRSRADSSDFAIGAVLSQQSKKDGKWNVVAFYSKSHNAVEQNYEIHDKSLLRNSIDNASTSNRTHLLWEGVDFLFIDEVSMISCKMMCQISQALSEAKGNTSAFGGINIIFAGNLAQLPPVVDQCLYGRINVTHCSKSTAGQDMIFGKLLWLFIDKIIILTKQH
ncbi:hypothetical protein J132_06619 [Termitomyces sp. J132]|nr:hypothetical protein J132_06619 [Termitomyces sp. J132]